MWRKFEAGGSANHEYEGEDEAWLDEASGCAYRGRRETIFHCPSFIVHLPWAG